MTENEWLALIELLSRIPVTQAERLWLAALVERELARLREVAK